MFRDGPVSQQMIVDAGHHGKGTGGHGHADALSLQWIIEGRQALSDPGTFSYPNEIQDRDAFRATSAHNTLEVDGLSQAEPAGPFSWQSLPQGVVERWAIGEHVGLFVGSHNGYRRLPKAVTHRRWVAALDEGQFFVRDVVCGVGPCRLDSWWHVGPEYRFEGSDAWGLSFKAENGSGISLLTPPEQNWARAVLSGDWSPAYGRRVSAPVARFAVETEIPAEFALLLLPSANRAGIDFRRLEEPSDATPSVYRLRDDGATRVLCCWDGEGVWQWRAWRSDAAFLCSIASATTQCLFLAGVSYFEVGGKVVLQSERPLEYWEWVAGDGREQSAFSEPEIVTTLETGALAAVASV
jgi:hypothetical protein